MENIEYLKENYDCLIFDCDNTLAYTMHIHAMAYEYAFNLYNVPFDYNSFNKYASQGGKVLLNKLVLEKGYSIDTVNNIRNYKSDIIGGLLDKHLVPNVKLINLIKNYNHLFKIIVVSNGRKNSIHAILNKLGIIDKIDHVFTAEDFTLSKPYPEPYVLAYKKYNNDPSRCLVFEDNDVGIKSAKSAGLNNIKIITKEDFEL